MHARRPSVNGSTNRVSCRRVSIFFVRNLGSLAWSFYSSWWPTGVVLGVLRLLKTLAGESFSERPSNRAPMNHAVPTCPGVSARARGAWCGGARLTINPPTKTRTKSTAPMRMAASFRSTDCSASRCFALALPSADSFATSCVGKIFSMNCSICRCQVSHLRNDARHCLSCKRTFAHCMQMPR